MKCLQVLNLAYVILASLCTFLGVTGYAMYGSQVLDVVTFNLPKVRPFVHQRESNFTLHRMA